MSEIWKYEIEMECEHAIPRGAEILHVDVQRGVPCMWVKVNPNNIPKQRQFVTYGTGHEFDDEGHEYLGTCQLMDGDLIVHVFEIHR